MRLINHLICFHNDLRDGVSGLAVQHINFKVFFIPVVFGDIAQVADPKIIVMDISLFVRIRIVGGKYQVKSFFKGRDFYFGSMLLVVFGVGQVNLPLMNSFVLQIIQCLVFSIRSHGLFSVHIRIDGDNPEIKFCCVSKTELSQ